MSQELKIPYVDPFLLIVDKPAGIPVYPLREDNTGTVAQFLEDRFPELRDAGLPRQAGIVHRLDNTTSGLLVAARDRETYAKMRALWNTQSVTKTYSALVLGRLKRATTIATPIAHHPSNKKKMVVCETAVRKKEWKGREAKTKVVPKKFLEGPGKGFYTLVEVQITTGVRHQIRVHLASIGHPIAGDKLYQNPTKRGDDQTGLERPFLHLESVRFTHPSTGEKIIVQSPLAKDLAMVLKNLPANRD